MGGEEHRHALFSLQPPHDLPHGAAGGGVQARGRLVQDQKFGAADEPAGDIGAAALPARKFAEGAGEDVFQLEHPAKFCQPLPPAPARQAVKAGAHRQVLFHGEDVVQHGILEHDAEAPLDALRLAV